MDIYFHLVEGFGYPDPLKAPLRSDNAWKIYMICIKPHKKFSLIYADTARLEANEKVVVSQLFSSLLIATASGQPLSAHYHKKGDCHPAFDMSYKDHEGKHKSITVHRLRQGDVRLYFIYRSDNTIILLKLLAKFTQKLEKTHQGTITRLAQIVLRLKDPEQIRERVI
jgi:hypothetical protein